MDNISESSYSYNFPKGLQITSTDDNNNISIAKPVPSKPPAVTRLSNSSSPSIKQEQPQLVTRSVELYTNRKRLKIKSDADHDASEESHIVLDPLEDKRGITRVNVNELLSSTQANQQAIADLNSHMINHFVSLSDRNDKNDEVDLEFLEQMISAGGNINCKDAFGQTLSHEVIRCWSFEIYEFFMDREADIFTLDNYDVSLLHVAAGKNRAEILKDLFKRMYEKDKIRYFQYLQLGTKNTKQNILHFAAKYDNAEVIPIILSECKTHGLKIIDQKDKFGRTPLALAADLDRSEAAKILLEFNANPTHRDKYGQLTLVSMIEKMPGIAIDALDKFVHTFRSKRKQHFFLGQIGRPVGDVEKIYAVKKAHAKSVKRRKSIHEMKLDDDSFPVEGRLYPFEVAVEQRQRLVLQSPAMQELIKQKWRMYGRKGAFMELFSGAFLTIMWSITAIFNKSLPYLVCAEAQYIIPLIIWVFAVLFNIYLIVKEIQEFTTSRQLTKKRAKFKESVLQESISAEHPRWPDNKIYYESQLEMVKKEGNNVVQAYFSDAWNIIDWIVYGLLFTLTVIRLTDMFLPSEYREDTCNRRTVTCHVIDTKGYNNVSMDIFLNAVYSVNTGNCLSDWYNRLFSIAIIMLWLRLFKFLRAFRSLGPFIVIITKMGRDVTIFMIIYIVIFIPFCLAFYIMFGEKGIETMTSPYELVFTCFRMIMVDDYNFDGMYEKDPVMAYLLVALHLFVSAVLMINLMIALLSDSFQRVYDNAQEESLLQQAESILSFEYFNLDAQKALEFAHWLKTDMNMLSVADKEKIKSAKVSPATINKFQVKNQYNFTTGGNPLILDYDDDDQTRQEDDNKTKKASVQSLNILEDLQEKFEHFPTTKEHTNHVEVDALVEKVNYLTVTLNKLEKGAAKQKDIKKIFEYIKNLHEKMDAQTNSKDEN